MSLDVHAGDVGEGFVVPMGFGVEDQRLAASLANRALEAEAEIGRCESSSNSTREMSWIEKSHSAIILTISVNRTTPLSL
jgi:hypothetical protein